jgi:hypothetical protein
MIPAMDNHSLELQESINNMNALLPHLLIFSYTSAGARAMHGFGAEVCVEEVQ